MTTKKPSPKSFPVKQFVLQQALPINISLEAAPWVNDPAYTQPGERDLTIDIQTSQPQSVSDSQIQLAITLKLVCHHPKSGRHLYLVEVTHLAQLQTSHSPDHNYTQPQITTITQLVYPQLRATMQQLLVVIDQQPPLPATLQSDIPEPKPSKKAAPKAAKAKKT